MPVSVDRHAADQRVRNTGFGQPGRDAPHRLVHAILAPKEHVDLLQPLPKGHAGARVDLEAGRCHLIDHVYPAVGPTSRRFTDRAWRRAPRLPDIMAADEAPPVRGPI